MPRKATPPPGALAAAVQAEIRAAQARISPKLTDTCLAEKAGMSQNYLSKRLRGVMPFTIDDMERLAPILRTTPDELFNAAIMRWKQEQDRNNNDGHHVSA